MTAPMGIAVFLWLVTPIVALYTGLFHGSIWFHRRGAREHLWFTAMALGVTGFAAFAPEIWRPDSAAKSQPLLSIQLSFAAMLLVGFARFTAAYLRIERPRALNATTAYAVALALGGLPGGIYYDRSAGIRRHFPGLGIDYVEAELTVVGGIAVCLAVVWFVYWISQYARNVDRGDVEARPILVPAALWLGFGVSDCLVSFRLYSAPYLLAFGYLALVVGISIVLVRRFIRSMDEVERLAGNLHDLVDARTAELRQKDQQLAQGEKMAAIGTLAAGIAHEINNPMAFVTSNLNRLQELWTKPDESADVEELLAECREGTARIQGIVSNLLQVARRSEARTEPVDLCAVVRSVLPIVQHEARFRATLEADLDPVPPVTGDPGMLAQVVLNLVLNAFQAIPEGSPTRNRVVVSTQAELGAVRLRVRDTGQGIAHDVLPRIFDPFFTTKDPGEGTGLGLAISEQIVRQHRGRIDVQSDAGGTVFEVTLPAAGSR